MPNILNTPKWDEYDIKLSPEQEQAINEYLQIVRPTPYLSEIEDYEATGFERGLRFALRHNISASGSQVSAEVCACGHSSDFHGLHLGKVQCFVDKCTCEDFAPSTPKEEKEEWISVREKWFNELADFIREFSKELEYNVEFGGKASHLNYLLRKVEP